MPDFANNLLIGYNYLIDLFIFFFIKLGFNELFFYFKIVPIIWFILFTWAAIIFARKIKNNTLFVAIFLIFIYFSGSFSYLLTLMHHQSILNASGLLSMPSLQTLTNIQYAFSLIILLVVLICIREKTYSWQKVLLLVSCVFLCMGMKFYGGTVILTVVGVYIIGMSLKRKKIKEGIRNLIFLIFATCLSIIFFYNPFVSLHTGWILKFYPLSTVHPIVESTDTFYLPQLVNARYFLLSTGHIGPKLIAIESLTLFIFIFFNFGIRIIGLGYIGYKAIIKKVDLFDICVSAGILISLSFSVLFIQKGTWWNTVQFLYYSLFLSCIYTSLVIYKMITHKKKIMVILGILFILLTLPNNLGVIAFFSHFPGQSYITDREWQGLMFLKQEKSGIVYAPIDKPLFPYKGTAPFPLYAHDDTSYISAFTNKQMYYADETQLNLTGIDYRGRQRKIEAHDCAIFKMIDYAYVIKAAHDKTFSVCNLIYPAGFYPLFSNQEVTVYSVQKQLF